MSLDDLKRQRDEFEQKKTDAKTQYVHDSDYVKYKGLERHYEDEIARLDAQIAQLEAQFVQTRPTDGSLQVAPGVIIHDYRLIRELGKGGNGTVWLVEKALPEGGVVQRAMKILRKEISNDPQRVQRFRSEIGIAVQLGKSSQSLHILPVYEWDKDGTFVVMEYVPGETLRQRIDSKAHTLEQALIYLEPLARALDDAHTYSAGAVIHRDVKPENVLIGDRLYLTDFGLAVALVPEGDRITRKGERPGTGRYMAPEQWREQELSTHTDLYALAIIAYEMLTGQLPFIAENDFDLAKLHCERDLPEDSALPPEMLGVLRRGAAKRPEDRYASAGEFVHQLKNWQADAETLEARIREYTDQAHYEIEKLLAVRFVELSGDERTLRLEPKSKAKFKLVVYDDPFEGGIPLEVDHVAARTDGPKVYVRNVRERLQQIERAVLVGEPGAGKTWLLLRLAFDAIQVWRSQPDTARVPIIVWLNRFKGQTSFETYVRESVGSLAPYLDRLKATNRLFVLCDALNEMPQQYVAEVQAYLKNIPYFLVSCRVRDYNEQLKDLHPLEQMYLRELELPAIKELITKRLSDEVGLDLWLRMGGTPGLERFWQQVNNVGEGARFWQREWGIPPYTMLRDNEEWENIHKGTRLIPLCRNPYMAHLVCLVAQRSNGTLPMNRVELFKGFVQALLEREAYNAKVTSREFPLFDQIETSLAILAEVMQHKKTTILRIDDPALTGIEELLLKTAVDANLLVSDGVVYRFSHQLLQEYFAVNVLETAYEQGITAAQFFVDKLDSQWDLEVWRETILIWGEFRGGVAGANEAVSWLAPYNPDEALNIVLRHGAGYTLMDIEGQTRTALIESARAKMSEENLIGRAAAYRILGLYNVDNRLGIGLLNDGLPDIAWVTIPDDGEWIYQNEKHPGLPSFEISRYPITYIQYQSFIDDPEGFYNSRWWDELADEKYRWENQRGPREQKFKYRNHPRERVSWYDAMAFCRWLTEKLGCEIRLPTEIEWEKAARGREGLVYPYGNIFDEAKANTSSTRINQTTAVGIFNAGASPYGVEDMIGNVWEWCLTNYRNPVNRASIENISSNTVRVKRGGCWIDSGHSIRNSSRNYDNPDTRSSYVGFRICIPNV